MPRHVDKTPPYLVDMSCEQKRLLSYKTCSQDMSTRHLHHKTPRRQDIFFLNRHRQDTKNVRQDTYICWQDTPKNMSCGGVLSTGVLPTCLVNIEKVSCTTGVLSTCLVTQKFDCLVRTSCEHILWTYLVDFYWMHSHIFLVSCEHIFCWCLANISCVHVLLTHLVYYV